MSEQSKFIRETIIWILEEDIKKKELEIEQLQNQIDQLKPFRNLVYHIASKRQKEVDDYIRLAKQAIADYESVLST